jgi:hypothetical protein
MVVKKLLFREFQEKRSLFVGEKSFREAGKVDDIIYEIKQAKLMFRKNAGELCKVWRF